jgi:hypothetical protein
MGVPTSEVGYSLATTRRETTKVHKNMWWHWGKKKLYIATNYNNCCVSWLYVYVDIYTLQLCIIDLTQQGCHTLRLEVEGLDF